MKFSDAIYRLITHGIYPYLEYVLNGRLIGMMPALLYSCRLGCVAQPHTLP